MLEIAIIWVLSKRIGALARAKGRTPALYVVLFIGMWIGGEMLGAFASVATTGGGGPDLCTLYECAIGGAIVGALIAFGILRILPDVRDEFPLRAPDFDDRALGDLDYKKPFGPGDPKQSDFTKEPHERPRSEDDRYTTE